MEETKLNKNRILPSIPISFCLIPSEIQKHIAYYLTVNDLTNLSQTSFQMNKLLWGNLETHIGLIFQKIIQLNKETNKTFNISKFIELYVRYHSQDNFYKIKTSGWCGPSEAEILEIVKIEARTDLEIAKVTAKLMRSYFGRLQALFEIAKVNPSDCLIDATKAFEEMLIESSQPNCERMRNMRFEIFKLELLTNLNKTKNDIINSYIIRNNEDSLYKDSLLFETVKVECLFNPIEAKLTANTIQDELIRIDALIVIAKSEVSINFDNVKTEAQLIESHEKKCKAFLRIDRALLEKVKFECLTNPDQAIKTAQQIENQALKGLALLEIEKIKPSPNLHEVNAIFAMDLSKFTEEEDELILELIKFEALSNLDRAFAMAKVHICPRFQLQAIKEIVKMKALSNIQVAKAFAYTIPEQDFQEAALLEIVKIEAEQGINVTKTSIKEIKQPGKKVEAYLFLAERTLKKLGL